MTQAPIPVIATPPSGHRPLRRFRHHLELKLVALILALAFAYNCLAIVFYQRQMNQDMLTKAHLIAAAIDANVVADFQGTAADMESPTFHRLLNQLIAIKNIYDDIRYIYIMGKNPDGSVFFYLDNTPIDDADFDPPGLVYDEATPAFRAAVETDDELLEGPTKDQWGYWFTAMVPIRDPQDGHIVASLGIDIAVSTWLQRLLWTLLPSLILVAALLLVVFFGRRLLPQPFAVSPPPQKPRIKVPERVFTAAIGLVFTAFVAWRIHIIEIQQRQRHFNQLAISRTDLHVRALDAIVNSELEGMAKFIECSDHVTSDEFSAYAQFLVKNSFVTAWGWVEPVSAEARPMKEKELYDIFGNDTTFKEMDENGQLQSAATRPVYYPLIFLAPDPALAFLCGFDLGYDPRRHVAIEEAIDTGLPTASQPLRLSIAPHGPKGCTIVTPVFHLGEQRTLRGLAIAALQFSSLIGGDTYDDAIVDVHLSHKRDNGIVEYLTPITSAKDCLANTPLIRPFCIGGLTLAMEMHPTKAFYRANRAYKALVALVAGLAICGATAFGVGNVFQQRRRLEGMVKDRNALLSLSEGRLEQLASESRTVIWECNAEGLYTYVSPVSKAVFGYGPEELVGRKHFYDIHPAEGRNEFKTEITRLLANKQSVLDMTNPIETASGAIILVSTSAVPILNPDGAFKGFYGTDRDVTEREEMTRRLRRSQQEAEAANRAKSEFLTNMSHEIRTPINGIIGLTELMRQMSLNHELAEYVAIVNTSGQLLLQLVNELLDFSLIEAGQVTIQQQDFNLRDRLENLVGGLAMAAHAKKLDLLCVMPPDLPVLLSGDDFHLMQILMNLGSNAIKFTEKGSVVFSVSLESNGDEQIRLRFSVRDTGIGIPKEQQSHIFDTFFQADSSIKRRFGGAGLGLSIAKHLVEALGGTLSCVSVPGQGAEFSFSVPMQKQSPALETPPELPLCEDARALIVHHHQACADDLAARLQYCSISCETISAFAAANDAIRQAREKQQPFSLLFLDLSDNAPQKLTSLPDVWRASRIIAIVPLSDQAATQRLQALAIGEFLHAPIRSRELHALLSRPAPTHRGTRIVETFICDELGVHTSVSTTATNDANHNDGAASASPSALPANSAVKVLLAEDNAVNQKVALALLRRMGIVADVATNGREAVAMLSKHDYQAVLMDVQMPDMDGFEATAAIRDPSSTVRQHDIPIIAMTAHAVSGYQQQCLDAGMNDYISKPITPDALRTVLSRWLTRTDPL
ncbi:MAG: response regulator [Lentisphaerae bacterium]|nr:response regulator [Lentisphaerota bacterium]